MCNFVEYDVGMSKTQIKKAIYSQQKSGNIPDCKIDSYVELYNEIFDNRENAECFLSALKKPYNIGARYKVGEKIVNRDKLNSLKKQYQEIDEKIITGGYKELDVVSGFVTCPCCKSKVNSSYLSHMHCPVCRQDMRDAEKIAEYDALVNKRQTLKNQIKQEERKLQQSSGEFETMWLVKLV